MCCVKLDRATALLAVQDGASPPAEAEKPADDGAAEFRDLFREVINHRQRAFLVAYVQSLGIRSAARLSGVSRQSHYEWLRDDPLYREHFERAKRMLADSAEEEVCRRAYRGYDTPVIYRGKITGYYKSYSDALAMFMLKGLKPAVYRDNAPLPINGPTHINITVKRPEDKTPLAAGENGGVRQIAIPLPGDAEEPAPPEPGDDPEK
ncbi:MAG TPA: hypothetical protein VKH64_06060 [Candidatus Binatia bacterium]|nr:hypothetical protein [Candidatus Binatia bacterium]